jgi:hypothetical protein
MQDAEQSKPKPRSPPAVKAPKHPLFGALKAVTRIPADVDLTEPADPAWSKPERDQRIP